ncbi:MAG: polyhydroxyalkanoate synthesis regulator phasin [Phenylobacterium sp.]|jgi:polyhydroxyalkanoate synthesis regulator phasin
MTATDKATDKVGKFARNVWLAGLGAYGRSTETITKQLDKTYEESNQLFNELVSKGSEIQATIDEKIKDNVFERKVDEVREKLGLNQSVSEQQIDELTAKVDVLTTIVMTLAEKKLAVQQTQTQTQAPSAEPKVAAKSEEKVEKTTAGRNRKTSKAGEAS